VGGEDAVIHLVCVGFFAVVVEKGAATTEFSGDGFGGEAVAEESRFHEKLRFFNEE
jgi:hypothetical protein